MGWKILGKFLQEGEASPLGGGQHTALAPRQRQRPEGVGGLFLSYSVTRTGRRPMGVQGAKPPP